MSMSLCMHKWMNIDLVTFELTATYSAECVVIISSLLKFYGVLRFTISDDKTVKVAVGNVLNVHRQEVKLYS